MKKLFYSKKFLLIFLFIFVLLLGCDYTGEPDPDIPDINEDGENEPQAIFIITDWEQDYYEYSESWGSVAIYYQVENTGNVDIDFFDVYFETQCVDDSIYIEWSCDFGPPKGKTISYYTYAYPANKEAISVIVSDYDLTVYDW